MLLLWASARVERKEIDDESMAEERQEGGTRSKIFFVAERSPAPTNTRLISLP